MAKEWRCKCKDCLQEFGYSDTLYQKGQLRGHSRPERCPECRRQHAKEINTVGQPYFKVRRLRRDVDAATLTSMLGRLDHEARPHREEVNTPPPPDKGKFGITNEKLLEMFRKFENDPGLQVMVVIGPTGSGKSTYLPYRLVEPPTVTDDEGNVLDAGVRHRDMFHRYGKIVITQPRIQATRNIPAFIAKAMLGANLGAGFDIGFKHAKNPYSDWNTKLEFCTDGTLIGYLANGHLDKINTIMIDEAHERSLNIDILIGMLTQLLPLYPRLKLIIASATISKEIFIEHFERHLPARYREVNGERVRLPNCELMEFEGKSFEVTPHFPAVEQALPYSCEEARLSQLASEVHTHVADAIVQLLRDMHDLENGFRTDMDEEGNTRQIDVTERRGDVVGFLHGERPIQECVKRIREQSAKHGLKVEALPLYTTLPQEEQDKALLERPSLHSKLVQRLKQKLERMSEGKEPFADILAVHNNAGQIDEIVKLLRKEVEQQPA